MLDNTLLILWKNLRIRRKHWLLTICEISIPILVFSMIAYARSSIPGLKKEVIWEPTYHSSRSMEDMLYEVDVEKLSLWYTPYNEFTENIIKRIQRKLLIPTKAVKEFKTKDALLSSFSQNASTTIAAITFKGKDRSHLHYDLTIHKNHVSWKTDKLYVPTSCPEIDEDKQYDAYLEEYAGLQSAIDLSFIEYLGGTPNVTVRLEQFPDPPRTIDNKINQLFVDFLPLVTIFSYIFLCPALLQRVCEEKHSGTKEFMKMHGLKSPTIWFGWLIHALSTNILSLIGVVIIMKVPFPGVSYSLIERTDGTLLFVFLLMFILASISFCFVIAALISNPPIASLIGAVLWIVTYFIPQAITRSHEGLGWHFKIIFALFPNMSLYYGYKSISLFEIRGVGAHWSNIFEEPSGGSCDLTIFQIFMVLLFDMVFFSLLSIYIGHVKPGEYGIPKPLNYPFLHLKKVLQRCCKYPQLLSTDESEMELVETPEYPISISNLHKSFFGHVAVDSLSFNIKANSITALLGKNGAGKTTTMSILTGMIKAISGNVKINGINIEELNDDERKIIGLCPQHNLLFPDLTVKEHLQFIAKLKKCKQTDEEINKLLESLGIQDKKDETVEKLSGGMKRKLCLCMALLGDSKILILDEPTSGMDPQSRREVWDLLREKRKTSTILLSTHFMDEADVLGDYVVIMIEGKITSQGTPQELKRKHDTGCHVSLLLNSEEHKKDVEDLVSTVFNEFKILKSPPNVLKFLLPLEASKKDYKDLFAQLEARKDELGILSIEYKQTTLNDVFFKCIEGYNTDTAAVDLPDPDQIRITLSQFTPGSLKTISALLLKRLYFLRRTYMLYLPPNLLAILIFLMVLWLTLSNSSCYNECNGGPCLPLELNIYGNPTIYFSGNSTPFLDKLKQLYSTIVEQDGGSPHEYTNVRDRIIETGKQNIALYNKNLVVAADLQEIDDEITLTALYSKKALHSVPISLNLAMNTILKSIYPDASIKINNTPLKSNLTVVSSWELPFIEVASVWIILFPLSIFFFTSVYIIFPNSEISSKFLKVQTIAGVKIYTYWLINIFFDVIFVLAPQLVVIISILLATNWLIPYVEIFTLLDIGALLVIFVSYSFGSLPFVYILSYRKTVCNAFTCLLAFGFFLGVTPAVAAISMEMSGRTNYMQIAQTIKLPFSLISPQFTLSHMILKFLKKFLDNFNWKYMDEKKRTIICKSISNPCCEGDETDQCRVYQNYFLNKDLKFVEDISLMLGCFVVYFAVLLTIHYKPRLRKIVFLTRNFLQEDSTSALVVKNLFKNYGNNKEAVKNLSMSIEKQECFGLLGVNGAGKSTTFKILTKLLNLDKGEITLTPDNEKPISITRKKYLDKIGYCPQENYLNPYLSGKEIITTMLRIKGWGCSNTLQLLEDFGLTKYQNIPSENYSGGNKRKLSTCLAFIGQPQVIMLDEPTSGVDPESQKKIWGKISESQKQSSFLLCSHSMDECERLCNRVSIMKEGAIAATGDLLQLKDDYRKGFTIELKKKKKNEDDAEIREKMDKLGAKLLEAYKNIMVYEVANKEKRLSEIFEEMEILVKSLGDRVEDYNIKQNTLEDIFLNIAKNNVDGTTVSSP